MANGAYIRFLKFAIEEDLVLLPRAMDELLDVFAQKSRPSVDRSSPGLFLSQVITLGQVQFHPVVSPMLQEAVKLGSPGDRLVVVPAFIQESAPSIAISTIVIARKLSREEGTWEQKLESAAPEISQVKGLLQAQYSSTMNLVLGRIWERGGSIRQLGQYLAHFQIGEGTKGRLYHRNTSHNTSFVGSEITYRKDMCNIYFSRLGLPVARQMIVTSQDEALTAARQIGFPVVLKPLAAGRGRAVFANLDNEASVKDAWQVASEHGPAVVEKPLPWGCIPGSRSSTVNLSRRGARCPPMSLVMASAALPELLDKTNQARSRDPNYHSYPGADISDPTVAQSLSEQGVSPQSVPDEGNRIWLRHNSNLSTGGVMEDWTKRVHPENARLAEAAAKAVDVDICGVDFVADRCNPPVAPDRWRYLRGERYCSNAP